MSTTATPSNASALTNAAAAFLLQQRFQNHNYNPLSASGVNSVTAQAILKQQEDQLRATRLLLQQRQIDELVASNPGATGSPPASRSNSLLARGPGGLAGLLGISSANALGQHQDSLAAFATVRRASVQSVSSTMSNAAANAAAEEEPEEEDDVSDQEYFKTYALNKDDQSAKEDADDKACNESFPHKLYRMLYEAEQDNQETIVSFLPSGRGFTIHKPREFVAEIMPRYFTTRRIASFQRQLNLYGFRRISEGKEKGAYFHKDFIKGKRTRVQRIKRKSTATRPSPTSFAHRFATAPLQFPSVPASSLYGGGYLTNTGSSLNINNATKELLLARYVGNVGAPASAPTTASLLEITRKGLMAAGNNGAISHQDILRNAAASLLFKNNTSGPY